MGFKANRAADERVLEWIRRRNIGHTPYRIGKDMGMDRGHIRNTTEAVRLEDVGYADFWGDDPRDAAKGYQW